MPNNKNDTARAVHARHHVNLRLERWHRRSLYATVLVLFLSGAAWLIARYFLRPVTEFGETVHPIEPWSMKLHGASVMVVLFFLGSLLNSHLRRAVKSRRNLTSGWSLIATMVVLIVTGFVLYYLAGENDRPFWSLVHWALGLAVPVIIFIHVLVGRRSRQGPRH
jgi:hypothetical protein